MMNIDFKNVTENLVYIIATNILTAVLVYNVSMKTNKESTLTTLNALTPTIDAAIARHTTAITHAIDISGNKFKKNDSLTITIDQKPISTQDVENISSDVLPLIKPVEVKKDGFFKRLFSKKK